MDEMLSYIEEALEAKNVFKRNRKSMKTQAFGILLYHLGVSSRNCSAVLSSFEPASHEAVRVWYHRAAGLFRVYRGPRRMIAVDETKIRIHGKWHILWAAVDIDTWEILGVWITQG